MQKIEGIEKVSVSLKDGLTLLDLKPANTVTMAKLREIIKNNGFVSKEAVIVAHGSVGSTGDFEVSGTGERLRSTGKPVSEGQNLWRLTSPAKSASSGGFDDLCHQRVDIFANTNILSSLDIR